jgi:hypothetical protein
MYLIEIFLPVTDNEGTPYTRAVFDQVRQDLIDRWGGVTAFLRAPAEGTWKEENSKENRDEIIIYEVMTESLDRPWWKEYKEALKQRFRQKDMVIRAAPIERL